MSQTQVPEVGTGRPANDWERLDDGSSQPEGTTFWSSMPRVLTALGGLVTAAATAGAVYFGAAGGGDPDPPTPQSPVIILPQPPAPAPEVGTIAPGQRTQRALAGEATAPGSTGGDAILVEWLSSLDVDTAAMAAGCANGFAEDCGGVLVFLESGCTDGFAVDCDVLYLVSPTGSELQDWANTCGGRVPGNTRWCRDLVETSAS